MEEDILKLKNVRNKLRAAAENISSASDLMRESIKINDTYFKAQSFDTLKNKLESQASGIDYNVIPAIQNGQ